MFEIINDNWDLKYKIESVFKELEITQNLNDDFEILSGGEKQKILTAKVFLENRDIIFFDEPTNNLDKRAKEKFFNLIDDWNKGIVIVSHDRELLNKMNVMLELKSDGIKVYTGNYDEYEKKKFDERQALIEKEINLKRDNRKMEMTKIQNEEQQRQI